MAARLLERTDLPKSPVSGRHVSTWAVACDRCPALLLDSDTGTAVHHLTKPSAEAGARAAGWHVSTVRQDTPAAVRARGNLPAYVLRTITLCPSCCGPAGLAPHPAGLSALLPSPSPYPAP
ncbi:hypothetical protein ACFC1T_09210 [Kitasatospora sp. NPDC056076]|uniref:hypothetical protein n=1 Tax=Kitasatospora sp. NPDC056076 TaxID=3345703 RepID=UPI0035DE4A4B